MLASIPVWLTLLADSVFQLFNRPEPYMLSSLHWPAMAFVFLFIVVFCMRGGRGFIKASVLLEHKYPYRYRPRRGGVKTR